MAKAPVVKRSPPRQSDAAQAELFGSGSDTPVSNTSASDTFAADASARAMSAPVTSAMDASATDASATASATNAPGDAALARQFATIPDAWRQPLDAFLASPTYARLCAFVDGERAAGKTIYPAQPFRALTLTSPADVKVVILGQDPYHGEDHGIPQAHGLAFSVPPGVRPPPSLRNICKEISAEFGFGPPPHGCLDHWAGQGVLLLNTVLTVERDKAASHAKHGWEACTDALIAHLGRQPQAIVFMLWGAHAQAKRALLAQHAQHLVLEAPHPSPLSAHRGFFGCGHFAQANQALEASGRTPIDWRIPPA